MSNYTTLLYTFALYSTLRRVNAVQDFVHVEIVRCLGIRLLLHLLNIFNLLNLHGESGNSSKLSGHKRLDLLPLNSVTTLLRLLSQRECGVQRHYSVSDKFRLTLTLIYRTS